MSGYSSLDPRVNAFRPDLADAALSTLVKADRYVEAEPSQCVLGVVPLFAEPSLHARRISEIRYGEFLDVFEKRADGFVWVQNRMDRAVGYIPTPDILSQTIASLANRVKALSTFVYAEPDVRAPLVDRLTLGSFVSVMRQTGDFLELASGGYVSCKHVAPTEDLVTHDYVFTAGRMLGVPYLSGGRTPLGFDAGGLVQLALDIAGIDAPRFSDQQLEAFGQPFTEAWREKVWLRGDLVFFKPHHVGIMTGQDHVINANDHALQVVVEPLEAVMARGYDIVATGRPIP